MNLELHKIAIRKLEWGPRTGARDHVLTVNKEELVSLLLEDPALRNVEAELVHPGESVRILPCKDAVEPRCKLDARARCFPAGSATWTPWARARPWCSKALRC